MERVVLLCQRDSDVHLDLFDFFRKKLEGTSILMVYSRETEDLSLLREEELKVS